MNKHSEKLKNLSGRTLLRVFLLVLGLVFLWGIWRAAFPPQVPLQEQMEARTISIASKVPGRVLRVIVEEGDFVKAGDAVAEMHLPELEAKLSQVEALEREAQVRKSLVDEGSRPQEILAAKAEWERALAGARMAEKTWSRIAALYRDRLVSAQRYDEAKTQYEASAREAEAAKQAWAVAVIGARAQEKAAAGDAASGAVAGVEEVASLVQDKTLTPPSDGQVDKVILVGGELAGAGFPVLTVVNLDDQWATFNIREKDMPGIAPGTELRAEVPASNATEVAYKVYYISPRANYATWRSTRQDSGYDMKTFEVRARPVMPVKDLRPGMSVLVRR